MELAQTFEECDSVNQLQQLQYGGQQVKHTDTERSPLQPAHTPPPTPPTPPRWTRPHTGGATSYERSQWRSRGPTLKANVVHDGNTNLHGSESISDDR